MPRAATASVVYWETNRDWAATATTVRAYCRAEGKPMAKMFPRYFRLWRRCRGCRPMTLSFRWRTRQRRK